VAANNLGTLHPYVCTSNWIRTSVVLHGEGI
jgi:hypothetical protein